MLEVRVNQSKPVLEQPGLEQPGAFGEHRYRMNRWLPLAPMAGLIGTMIAILIYPPLDRNSFSLTTFIIAVPCVFLISYVQKKQKRGDDIASFFPMTAWLAFAPICIAAILFANGALDRSPVEPHPVVVTQRLVRHGKSTSYYLQTSSWRANHSSETLQVTYVVFTQFQTNDAAIVEVHRGALGIPWLGAIRKRA